MSSKEEKKKILHWSAAKFPIQNSAVTGYQHLHFSCESTSKTLTNKTQYEDDTSFRFKHNPHADAATPTQTLLY